MGIENDGEDPDEAFHDASDHGTPRRVPVRASSMKTMFWPRLLMVF